MITDNKIGDVEFVNSARIAYDRWSNDGGASFSPDTTVFCRFCSSQAYAPNTFGDNRGFVDQLYITGEECVNGRLFVLDSSTRDFYQLSGFSGSSGGSGGNGGMPFNKWENAALIDTGETEHIALLLSPDGNASDEFLVLYIGQKGKNANGNIADDFLSRNGLANGEWFYLKSKFPDTGKTNKKGKFQKGTNGALGSKKLEDIDTNPSNPTQVVLAEQNMGIYTFDFSLDFARGEFNSKHSSFSITKIKTDDIINPDNVDWTVDGHIFVNEDSARGAIWRMPPDGKSIVKVGETTTIGESSGIFDISALLDYAPGSIMVTNSQGVPSSTTILINPSAEPVEPVENEVIPTPQVGVTPAVKPAGALIYEAEDVTLAEYRYCNIEHVNPGFSADGYADFLGFGSSLEWTVDSLVSGWHEVHVAYAAGSNRPANFIVDGATFGEFSFLDTGGWSKWDTETFVIELAAGSHTFKVVSEKSNGPNIDWMAISSPEPAVKTGGAAGSNLRGGNIDELYMYLDDP
jgi:hypothetical protein